MVLGFGSGERFKEPKELTPGPGQYNADDPRYKTNAEIKSSFMGGDRFTPDSKEAPVEQGDVSPPKERKIRAHNPGDGRKFTWATQRIHDLSKELESVNKHLHIMEEERRGERDHLLTEAEHYLNEMESLKGTLQSTEADKQLIAAKARELEALVLQLQQQLEQQQAAYETSSAEKQAELEATQRTVAGLNEEAQHTAELLRVAEESKEVITKQLEQTLGDVAALEADVADKGVQLSEQGAALTEARALGAQLEQQRDVLQQEVEALQAHGAQVQQALDARVGEVESLQAELQGAQSQLARVRDALEEETSALLAVREELGDLQEQHDAVVAQLHVTGGKLEEALKSVAERDDKLESQRAELAATQDTVTQQQESLAAQQQQLEQHAQHAASLAAALTDKEQEAAALHDALAVEKRNLQEVVASLEGVQVTLAASMKQAEEEMQHKQAELDQLGNDHTNLQAEYEALSASAKQQAEQLSSQLSTLDATKQALQADLDATTQQLQAAQAQATDLTTQLEQATAQCFSLKVELNNERAAKGAEQKAHEETKAFLSSSLAAKEALVVASQDREEGLRQELKRQLDGLEGAAGVPLQQQGARDMLKALTETYQVQLVDARARADALQQHAASLESQLETTNQQLESTQQQLHDLLATTAELETLVQQRTADAEATASQLAHTAQQLREAHDAMDAQRVQLSSDLEALTAQVIQRDAALAETTTAADGYHQRAAAAEAQVTDLAAQLEAARQDLVDAQEASASLEQQLEFKSASCETLQAKHTVTQQALDAVKQQLQEATEDLEAVKEQVVSDQAAYEELLEARDALERQLQEMIDAKDALEQELQAAVAAQRDLQQQLGDANEQAQRSAAALSAARDALREDLEQAVATQEALREELHNTAAERDSIKAATSTMRQRLQEEREHAAALQEALQRNSELANMHEVAEQQLAVLQTELHATQARLAQYTSNKNDPAARAAALEEQLRAVQHEAGYHRNMAQQAEAALLENRRLADDNAVLASRMKQLQVDLQELTDSGVLGHNNPKQKIQYHLRLKQELEELRNECTVLLRERFHLEQCIRYLSVRADLPIDQRTAVEVAELQAGIPAASLAKHAMFATNMGRKSAALAGRGRVASEEQQGTAYRSKGELQAAIADAVHATSENVKMLTEEVGDKLVLSSEQQQQQQQQGGNAAAEVESSILRRIWDVCSPSARHARATARGKDIETRQLSARGSRPSSAACTPRGNASPRGVAGRVNLRASREGLPAALVRATSGVMLRRHESMHG